MTQTTAFSIHPITLADKDRVLGFLRASFFRDEPLGRYLGLVEGPDSQCVELEEYSVQALQEGISFVAVNPVGKILGVRLNGLLTRDQHSLEPPENEMLHELDKCVNLKFRKILKLLKFVYWKTNPFRSHPHFDNVLHMKMLSVDSSCRRQGIAKALIQKTIDMARERSIPLLRVDCTSAYSARAMESLGFRKVLTLPYSDYRDPEGCPVFAPVPPHTAVTSFVYPVE